MGKFLIFSRIKLKFHFWLHKKRWYTFLKFQLEITSIEKVIAKKPLTNLYEMNSKIEGDEGKAWITEGLKLHNTTFVCIWNDGTLYILWINHEIWIITVLLFNSPWHMQISQSQYVVNKQRNTHA